MAAPKATPTAATAPQVIRALLDAGAPSLTAARVIAAQTALETAGWGSGGGGFYNWNLGNIKATDADAVTLPDGLTYEGYPSLLAGAQALLQLLATRYASALPYANDGDVSGFVTALKSGGYFEAPLQSYITGTEAWYTRIGGVLPSPPWTQIALAAGVVGLGLGGFWAIRNGLTDRWVRRILSR